MGSSTRLFFAPCTVFQPPSSTRWTPARRQTQPSAHPRSTPGEHGRPSPSSTGGGKDDGTFLLNLSTILCRNHGFWSISSASNDITSLPFLLQNSLAIKDLTVFKGWFWQRFFPVRFLSACPCVWFRLHVLCVHQLTRGAEDEPLPTQSPACCADFSSTGLV